MTSRERMLTTYHGGQADAVPVSPELWDATAIAVNGVPFHQLMGPFAERPWWKTHLECYEHFRADAWIVPAPGPTERQQAIRTGESYFVDAGKRTVESRITYRTERGTLARIARTTGAYADWLLKHPVEKFPQDMQAYEEYFFDHPVAYDLSEILHCLEGVGKRLGDANGRGTVHEFSGTVFARAAWPKRCSTCSIIPTTAGVSCIATSSTSASDPRDPGAHWDPSNPC